MNLIASADKIGRLARTMNFLIRIPDDMKHSRRKTTGNVVVMGRKTLESFQTRPFKKDRVNIVLTRNADYAYKAVLSWYIP